MNNGEFHIAFNMEMDKKPAITSYPSFMPSEIDYFLNLAVRMFVKERYSGFNISKAGFQQSEKRTEDLGLTIVTLPTLFTTKPTSVNIAKPADLWLIVGEDAYIASDDYTWKYTEVNNVRTPIVQVVDPIECTLENFTRTKRNTLSDHRLSRGTARPLRLDNGASVYLETDGNYYLTQYVIYYIKTPDLIDFRAPYNQFTYIPEMAHDEIVALAVQLALENVSEPRIETHAAVQQGNE